MEEQIKQHAIWPLLSQILALRGNDAFVESAADPQITWDSQRIFQFSLLVEQRLRQVPATLMSVQLLNQLQNGLASVLAELSAFVSNRNVGHLSNAASQLDSQCYPYLSQIPIVALITAEEGLGRLADDYSHQVQGILKTVFNEKARLQTETDSLRTQVQTLAQQVTELTSTVATQKAEAAVTVQSLQTTYSAKEQEFSKAFEGQLASHEGTYAKLIENFRAEQAREQTIVVGRSEAVLSD